MKKHLLLLSAALGLCASAIAQETTMSYVAQELDGKHIKITNNITGNEVAIVDNALQAVTGSTNNVWHAEYDATEGNEGVTLRNGTQYLSALPNTQGASFTLTTDRNAAGRYRFYQHDSANPNLCIISCSKFMDGNAPVAWVNGGADATQTTTNASSNVWFHNGQSSSNITRWGAAHNNSKWQYTIVEVEEEPDLTKRFVKINSEYLLADGAQYVVGHIGKNDAWQAVNPLCFKANADNTAFTLESCPSLQFSDDMIWTAKVNKDIVCNSSNTTHGGAHTVLQLTRGDKAIDLTGTKVNNVIPKNMATLSTLSTNIEFIPLTDALTGLTNDLCFNLHINPTNASPAHFQQYHVAVSDGSRNFYSKAATVWQLDLGTSSTSSLTYVYLVVDPANLEPAAKAYWNQIIEEDIAANQSYTDAYKAALRKRALPELDGMTADNLVEKLTEAYHAVESDFTANWITNTANAYRPTGTIVYGKTGFPYAVLKNTTNTANNINLSADNLKIHKGSNQNECEYTLSSFNPLLQVVGMEFDFTVEENNGGEITNTVVTVGDQTYQWAGEAIHVKAPNNTTITVSGTNHSVTIPSFSLNVNKTNAELYDALVAAGGKPQTSGWYQIMHVKGIDAHLGKYLTLEEEELDYSNGAYPYYFSSDISARPAASYIYIDVENGTYKVQSANGHWINENCTAALTKQSATAQDLATDANDLTTIRFSRWHNIDSNPNVFGKSSTPGANNRWLVMPVDAANNYDIWSVEINGGNNSGNALEITHNCNVTCDIPANKGAKKVYNGGKYFFTPGTVPTAADFTVSDLDTDNVTPVVTVDAATKTITVNHLTKEEYLALHIETIENAFAPYQAQTIYAEGIVDNALEAALEGLQAAAGEDDILTAEEIAAINAHMTGQPSAENVLAFSKSAVGKVIHLTNHHNNHASLMTFNTNNNQLIMTGTNPDKHALANMWELASCDDNGYFTLRNMANGKYYNHANNSNCTLVDSPNATNGKLKIVPSTLYAHNDGQTDVLFIYPGTNEYKYMHYASVGVNKIVGWNGTGTASHWSVTCADIDELAEDIDLNLDIKQSVEGEATTNGHVFTFSHEQGIALNEGITENVHVITLQPVTPKQTETTTPESVIRRKASNIPSDMYEYDGEAIKISLHNATATDNGLSLEATGLNPERLDKCYYEVTVPTGVFTVGEGKHNKAQTMVFTVDANGGVTGIENVEANVAAPAVDVIFDLQGRRLSKPMRGINIINGRKVLVK